MLRIPKAPYNLLFPKHQTSIDPKYLYYSIPIMHQSFEHTIF